MVMEMVNVNVVCASSSASDLLERGVIIMMSTAMAGQSCYYF